jgi:predicted nucleic acid-binding protein
MSLVLDGSVALSWQFEDEQTPASLAVLDRVSNSGAWVPDLWYLEVANALLKAIRRKRYSVAQRDAALARLSLLDIVVDSETAEHAWGPTLALSDRFGLTPYDAAYLEVAMRRGLALATLDQALRQAAGALGIEVLGG